MLDVKMFKGKNLDDIIEQLKEAMQEDDTQDVKHDFELSCDIKVYDKNGDIEVKDEDVMHFDNMEEAHEAYLDVKKLFNMAATLSYSYCYRITQRYDGHVVERIYSTDMPIMFGDDDSD